MTLSLLNTLICKSLVSLNEIKYLGFVKFVTSTCRCCY